MVKSTVMKASQTDLKNAPFATVTNSSPKQSQKNMSGWSIAVLNPLTKTLISSVWCVKSNLLVWQVKIDTKPRKDTMPVKLQLSSVAVNHQRNDDNRPNSAPSTKYYVSIKVKLILRMALIAMKKRPGLPPIVELILSITLWSIGLVVNRVIDGTTQLASILLINLKAN